MTGVALLALVDPLVGAVLVLTGALVWWRGRSATAGALLVLAGGFWWAGAVLPSLVSLYLGPLVHLVATYPGRPRPRPAAALVAVLLGWFLAIAGGITAGPWPVLATATLLAATATVRAARAAARGRHLLSPEEVAALLLAAVLALAGANLWLDLDADLAVALAYDVVVALVAVSLGVDLLRSRSSDDTAAEALTDLAGSPGEAPGLQPRLRRILGDPGLAVGLWSPERGAFVDENGDEVERTASRTWKPIGEHGQPSAVMTHSPALDADPELLQAAKAAVRLTAANAALRREALSRVARLAEARHRIVEAADEEAQALAAELERGPLARLQEVSEALAGLDASGCAGSESAQAVLRELQTARREIEDLAHGVRPPDLAEGGLARALPALADLSVTTDVTVDVGRLDPSLEAGVYFFCAEGLANAAKHASASQVHITVRADQQAVVAEVVDDGVGGADPQGSGLLGLKDRIEALDGTLSVLPASPHGVRLVARVPTGRRRQG